MTHKRKEQKRDREWRVEKYACNLICIWMHAPLANVTMPPPAGTTALRCGHATNTYKKRRPESRLVTRKIDNSGKNS
jgi:hypothetical protein